MIVFKILGLAALIFGSIWGIFYFFKGLSAVVNSPAVDGFLNPPVTPYNYSPDELWEPPTYWTNWQKCN